MTLAPLHNEIGPDDVDPEGYPFPWHPKFREEVRALYRRLAAEYEKEPVTPKRGCGAPGDPYPL